jgi:N-acetylmuramoyl-L-alanine amidase
MNFKYRIIVLVLALGCASLPKEKITYRGFPKKGYISLTEFARRHDFKLDFDPFFKKAYLNKGERIEVIFAFDSPVAVVNGHIVNLGGKVKFENGELLIPSQGLSQITQILLYGVKKEYIPPGSAEWYRIRKIVIDPGHGGKDPGAIGPSGLKEKDITLSIARILRDKLTKAGYKVVMTRDSDKFISLWKRIYIANRENADLFISIHANSSRSRRASGFEVYYLAPASDEEARALAAAENYPLGIAEKIPDDTAVQATIWDLLYSENRKDSIQLAKNIIRALNKKMGTRNRGIKSANFYVLRGAQMPAILVEVGFISNRYEESKLKTWTFKNKIADALVEGIKNYEREYILTAGFTR